MDTFISVDTFKPKFTGMNFHNMDGTGWPYSVVVDNGGSVLEGTYESMTYVPERTCKVIEIWTDVGTAFGVDELLRHECSACGCIEIDDESNYCPNCGAKVVN